MDLVKEKRALGAKTATQHVTLPFFLEGKFPKDINDMQRDEQVRNNLLSRQSFVVHGSLALERQRLSSMYTSV